MVEVERSRYAVLEAKCAALQTEVMALKAATPQARLHRLPNRYMISKCIPL